VLLFVFTIIISIAKGACSEYRRNDKRLSRLTVVDIDQDLRCNKGSSILCYRPQVAWDKCLSAGFDSIGYLFLDTCGRRYTDHRSKVRGFFRGVSKLVSLSRCQSFSDGKNSLGDIYLHDLSILGNKAIIQ